MHRARLESLGYEVVAPPLIGQQFLASELATMSKRVVGIIAGDDELDSRFFSSAPDLRVVIRWGVGMDSVDLEAAREHHVVVRNTPGVFGREVADAAFAFILMLARGHHAVDLGVRAGDWPKKEGITLAENRLGVIGFGSIGREVAARGLGFGMNVVTYDPFVKPEEMPQGVELMGLDELLSVSRFVVITCPSTPETYHLINRASLKRMRRDSYIVNVARGPIVDEAALAEAIADGTIAGAGLDVFEVEPLPTDSRLRALDGVILGAHNGSNTREGVRRASQIAVDLLIDELAK